MKLRHVLTRPHPLVVALVYGSILANAFARGHAPLGVAIGIVAWTFLEYAAHRWVLHAFTGRTYDFVHGGHHREPHNVRRAIVPLTHSLAVVAILHGVAAYANAWSYLAGLLLGYAIFEIVHAALHTKARRFLGRGLRRHHARHHFVDEKGAFGVTTRFWDWVFRTMPAAPHPFVACNDEEHVNEAL